MEHPQTRKLTGDHCQCGACGAYFNSTKAFDKHRIGPHGWGTRSCRSAKQMLEAGMSLSSTDWWITEGRPTGAPVRADSKQPISIKTQTTRPSGDMPATARRGSNGWILS